MLLCMIVVCGMSQKAVVIVTKWLTVLHNMQQ